MAQNASIHAYPGAQDFLNRALDSKTQIAVGPFETKSKASEWRQRCYKIRSNWREHNRRTYAEDHPMHGNSPWESITLGVAQVGEGMWWVTAVASAEGDLQGLQIINMEDNQ